MRPSPLQLEGYLVTELSFKAQPDFEYDLNNPVTTVTPSDLSVEVAIGEHSEDSLRRSCDLTIALADATGSKSPYVFRIVLVGFFTVSEHYPAESVEVMVNTNAPALLYSAAREMLASATGRGPYPSVTLPSVTFLPPLPDAPRSPDAPTDKKMRPQPKSRSRTSAKKAEQGAQKTPRKSSKK